jgi:molybdopterin molybdotransferase
MVIVRYSDPVEALAFEQARQTVIVEVRAQRPALSIETVPLDDAAGRVLAVDALADRPYPPSDRSIRDGFAVRAADLPGSLRVIGEIRAGSHFDGRIGPGECVRIMTGATPPAGADAIVMVEHTTLDNGVMTTSRSPQAGEFINYRGSEADEGSIVLRKGTRLRYPQIAMLATIGAASVPVFRKIEVAILATGDEIVAVEATPAAHQIRNSNSWALAAQVAAAGAIPRVLPVAPDDPAETARLIGEGLHADLLLLSGGVSAGEYDYVESVLRSLGAVFFFDRVKIRPGAPAVFGSVEDTFFFGLPGNPLSTSVTFAIFAQAAVELLSGMEEPVWPLTEARLTQTVREKPGLTRFLPAVLQNGKVTPIPWRGSSDVVSLARSNSYIVIDASRELYTEGDAVPVLPQ